MSLFAPIQKLLQAPSTVTKVPNTKSEKPIELKPLKASIATNEFDDVPDDFHKIKLNTNLRNSLHFHLIVLWRQCWLKMFQVASLNQRLANPEFQVESCTDLYPLNKFYVTKESKRCNVCEHNVIKPENNISSIKFKLHQMALYNAFIFLFHANTPSFLFSVSWCLRYAWWAYRNGSWMRLVNGEDTDVWLFSHMYFTCNRATKSFCP